MTHDLTGSGISSDSPLFLVPSLTLDSSDGYLPTMEMDEYLTDTLGYNLPAGYILRRHSDNPCSSKRSNVSSLVGANMDIGIYSLDRSDTCDGYPCGLINVDEAKALVNSQQNNLDPHEYRERSASSHWPSNLNSIAQHQQRTNNAAATHNPNMNMIMASQSRIYTNSTSFVQVSDQIGKAILLTLSLLMKTSQKSSPIMANAPESCFVFVQLLLSMINNCSV
ncbi:hypothetical protein Ciccas_005557 [Cichlidogyrus casuarinus]|uniref:Uncharacterized protein n=1 Tax=Cichlidogyrus casuarinus TaxID=1844966 RepID=A0ABD2Q8B4_9PLAT